MSDNERRLGHLKRNSLIHLGFILNQYSDGSISDNDVSTTVRKIVSNIPPNSNMGDILLDLKNITSQLADVIIEELVDISSELNRSNIDVQDGTQSEDRLLTIKEVGERLNVSRQSIVNYRKRGVIKETIIQGKVYVKESDLNTFINSDPNQS